MRNAFALSAALALLTSVAAAAPALTAQDAWVRAVPGADSAAAYLTLHNGGTAAVVIDGVRSGSAAHAMIHETTLSNGVSGMRPHEPLTVAPGATVRLAPGGMHIMLSTLVHPLTPGERVALTLLLAGGGTLEVSALVRPLT